MDLIYGLGYDTDGEVLDLAVDVGLIERGGAWLTYGDYKWQGKEKAKLALQKDPSLQENLISQIKSTIAGDEPAEAEPKVEEVMLDDKPISKKRKGKSESSAT